MENQPPEKKVVLEALLFSSPAPLSLRKLSEVTGWSENEIEEELRKLMEDYSGRGIRIRCAAGEYLMLTAPAAAPFVESLHRIVAATSLSRAALETLAVIAYKQPITKARIEALRGVRIERVLRNLLLKKLVRKTGQAPLPGRPDLYGTTPEFLKYFGLSGLDELPPLPEPAGAQEEVTHEGGETPSLVFSPAGDFGGSPGNN